MKDLFINFKRDFKNNLDDLKHKGRRIKQVPNLLTFSRLIAPLIIIPLIIMNYYFVAMVITICFALTDLIDGRIARKYNVVSEFGRQLDPICDKFFVGGIIIALLFKKNMLFIPLVFELLVSILTIYCKSKNGNPRTLFIGKIKTTFLYLLIAFTYVTLIYDINNNYYMIIYNITIFFQVLSLGAYSYHYIGEVKDAKRLQK